MQGWERDERQCKSEDLSTMDWWRHCAPSWVNDNHSTGTNFKLFFERLVIENVEYNEVGEYICKVKNEYGELERKVVLSIEEENDEENSNEAVRKEMKSIVKKQLKLFSLISRYFIPDNIFQILTNDPRRYSTKHHQAVHDYLKNAETEWN